MKKLVEYFARHSLVVTILTLTIAIIGGLSLMNLKQDLFPDVTLDAVVVYVSYPGASAKDVEVNAIIPIEREIKKIAGIEKYTSISMENMGRILVEIDEDVDDIKEVKDTLYRELSNVSGLPADVEEVNIIDMNPHLRGIYEFGVYIVPIPIDEAEFNEHILARVSDTDDQEMVKSGFTYNKEKKQYVMRNDIKAKDKERILDVFAAIDYEYREMSEGDLYKYTDKLEKYLLKVEGVSDVNFEGYRDREIKINVLPEKMNQNYISLNDVIGSIKKANIRMPGGTLTSGVGKHSIVTIGEFKDIYDVKDVIIRSNYEQKRITIDDIAHVEDGFKKENIQVRVNNNRGVAINVVKKADADIVKTVAHVKEAIEDLKGNIPEGMELAVISDDSMTITNLLDIVKLNAVIGFILVFILLLVFLMDIKVSFWTAFGIPITLLITFTFMKLFDFSINIISLGALGMLLGIIVDDSIVISESIFKYKSMGYDAVKSAYLGVKDVAAPVFVSILTTVVAFLPLFLITGMMGKFIFVLPATVVIALLASLVEALFFLPAHLGHSKKSDEKKEALKVGWFKAVENGYQWLLKNVLKLRYLVVLLFVGLLIFTIRISDDTVKRFVMVDDDSSDKLMIKCETVEGNSLSDTSAYVSEIERIIKEELAAHELLSIKTIIGHHNDNDREEEGRHENWALVTINLVPRSERERDADQLIMALKDRINIDALPDFTELSVVKELMGPDSGSPVNVKLIGNDKVETGLLADEIKSYLATIDGIINIEDNRQNNNKEWQLVFDFDRMAMLGVNTDSVAQAVRSAYEGTIATSIQNTDKDLDFRVQLDTGMDKHAEKDEKYLMNLLIPNNRGRLIKLKDVASLSMAKTDFAINHEDGDRAVIITADLKPDTLTSLQATKLISDKYSYINKEYPGTMIEFGGESEESARSLADLGMAYIVVIILIYFILIILFNDLTQPLLIMLTIPFGITGALLAFIFHGMPLTFMGIVGIIGLSGVVINDSIVMVDCINKELKKHKGGENFVPVIVRAAKERLRPVMLTTLTTTVGLLPTVYGLGGSSPIITPIAVALAYGLLFATLLTLVFIPSIFCIRLDIIGVFGRMRGRDVKKKRKLALAEESV